MLDVARWVTRYAKNMSGLAGDAAVVGALAGMRERRREFEPTTVTANMMCCNVRNAKSNDVVKTAAYPSHAFIANESGPLRMTCICRMSETECQS